LLFELPAVRRAEKANQLSRVRRRLIEPIERRLEFPEMSSTLATVDRVPDASAMIEFRRFRVVPHRRERASVSIGTGFFAGDVLMAVTTGTAITASYNAGTGALSLSGTDSPADYQQVLRSVTFSSTSQNPTNFGADISRTIG